MVHITGDNVVPGPPELVFDTVADERNRYDPSILHAELLTDLPLGVGTRFRSVAVGVRRPVEMTVEITGYDRPHRLTTITRNRSMDIDSTLHFEPVGGDTRIRWSLQFHPRGALRLLTPLLPLVGRRQLQRVWAALETHLEQRPPTTSHRHTT